jgi:uncharacterized protein (UPF0332 family)
MAFPHDLLEQALHLANREPKRPKQASLRRAVSTAYYALFHLLSIETAKNWKRKDERQTIARMLGHKPMADACDRKRKELDKYFETKPAAGHVLHVRQHLHLITKTFVDMRQHRETADYNLASSWTRTDVLEKIQGVAAAFESWRAIRNESEAQNFLAMLLLTGRRN